MRGSPDLGRDGTNLQKPGQGILSSGQRLQFGPGLGGSLEVSEKKAQAGQPLLPWDSSGHLGTGQPPKVHQSLPTLGTRVPRRVRGAREGSWVPTADLEWLLGRSLIQSEKKSAQHSHHRVQKKPKTRDKAHGQAPPTHTGRSTTDLCTASPRRQQHKRRRTESPNTQASRGRGSWRSPWEEAGLAGPGGSRRLSDRRRSGRSEHHGAARRDTPAKSTEGRGGSSLRGHCGRCPLQRGVRRP